MKKSNRGMQERYKEKHLTQMKRKINEDICLDPDAGQRGPIIQVLLDSHSLQEGYLS